MCYAKLKSIKNIDKKLLADEEYWKMNAKIVNLPSIVGIKLSFNKMLETQLAQLVVINMSFKHGNFLCLRKTFAKFSVVITREENPLMVRHIPI